MQHHCYSLETRTLFSSHQIGNHNAKNNVALEISFQLHFTHADSLNP